jgi:putative membrane protein
MVMHENLDDAGRARIAAAVAEAESRTSVEIRLVLAQCSSHYGLFALIYPALTALIAGGIASAARPEIAGWMLFAGQAIVFAVMAAVLQWRPLRLALVPPAVKRDAAWRHARLHYASIGLKQPHIKSAVLLFCSEAERSVEILADDAVTEALPSIVWEPVVQAFRTQFAAGNVADAFVGAAGACAAILAPTFPAVAGQTNEISDDLVEL